MGTKNLTEFQHSDILEAFSNLDSDLLARYGVRRKFEITIVGSGPLIWLGILNPERRTTDIDVLSASQEAIKFFSLYGMNMAVATFLHAYPQNWQDRRQELVFEGEVLNAFTMSLEDLTIMKLLAFRERDLDDLSDIAKSGKLSWDQLAALINDPTEVRINLATEDEWEEFLRRYEWLLERRRGVAQYE